MKAIFEAINNIFSFVTPVSDFLWDFPTNFEWYANIPILGNFSFAIILLVFGHGLNMILNVLSVIVHGIRLNTLEFSSHLGMSWSGYKFKPFEEQK